MKTPSNPSKTAIKRVKNPLPKPESCKFCNSEVVVKTHIEIYGSNYGEWPWVYACSNCSCYVGMHPFTDIPLGTLADFETRKARNQSKKTFELIHKSGFLSRSDAYGVLSEKLGIKKECCHFGWFDKHMCIRAHRASNEILMGFN